MRIILLSFGFVEYTIPLANSLSKLEDVLLMEPKERLDPYRGMIKKDVNLWTFHKPRMRYPTNLVMVHRIMRQINEFKPDIMHFQRGYPWLNPILPLLGRTYPLIATIHDVVPHIGDRSSSRIPAFISTMAIKYADQVIVHGKKLKQMMIEKFNKPANNIHVVMRGDYYSFFMYNYNNFTSHQVKEQDHLVLFFGTIWEYKGLRYLIEAEPLITKNVPTAMIVIAGRGENFRKYEKIMTHKEKFIVYNQFIPNEMVAKLFQKACIVVLPYVEASQSGIVPLAYAFKKPVVVTSVGSIPEVVDDGETGYIVPPRNPQKLAEAIIELLKDKEKRKKMGENAYRKTKEELCWDNVAIKTIEVYKKALSDKFSSNFRRRLI